MILINFNRGVKTFNLVEEALSEIEKENVHPDMLQIFEGKFKEIKYLDLLNKSKNEISIQDLENEKNIIVSKFLENLSLDDGLLIQDRLYPYGSPEFHHSLKVGTKPIVKISIQFKIAVASLAMTQIRNLIKKSLVESWRLVKLQNKHTTYFAGEVWQNYDMFIVKDVLEK